MDAKAYTQSEGVQILFATAHGFFVEKGKIIFAGKQAAYGPECVKTQRRSVDR